MVDHTDARGELVFEQACRMSLEGIVSKRKRGPLAHQRIQLSGPAESSPGNCAEAVPFVGRVVVSVRRLHDLAATRLQPERPLAVGGIRRRARLPRLELLPDAFMPGLSVCSTPFLSNHDKRAPADLATGGPRLPVARD